MQSNDSESEPPPHQVGLALGGGGARGLAHILILEVFDELGLKPAMIAGTSIGAIFGGAYASGLSAREIRERATDILSRPAEIARHLFSGTVRSWPELLTFRPWSSALLEPKALMENIFPESANLEIAQLKIPFLAMATDFNEQSPVALSEGPLATAIAASMALPALFRPVRFDRRILVDGGLTDPLPYDRIAVDDLLSVAIDVTGRKTSGSGAPGSLEAVLASSQIMQNAIIREKLVSQRPDILIRPPVDEIRILEFYRIKAILAASEPIKEELKQGLDLRLSAAREKTI